MIGTVLAVFLLLLVGYGSKKLRLLRAEDSNVLNDIVVYITLPSMIFSVLYNYKQNLSLSIAKAPTAGFLMIIIVLLAAYAIGKAIKLNNATLAGFILAAGFGNTGFLGYPVIQTAFKDPLALVAAVLYDEFSMAIPLYVIGMVIVAVLAGEKAHHSQVLRAFKMPQVWAIPIALAARQFDVPQPIVTAIHYLGNGTVPLVMISLGLMLSARSIKGYGIPLAIVCVLKLAVLPVLTLYALRACGVSGSINQSTVVEAGMPTAMMAGVLVSKFGENAEFVAGVIFVTTLLSILTIPATLFLLGVPAH
ncbi:MAG TPA: AEC family transporter [Armatimonadota bacterium]|jgi:hypothetical protein